ncbi:hypothetical protein EVAR_101761_1 [Eumeta japonica]|uniref:Uncharacterized protein n=1 Tax=Eumeta variegata TaxID=151549 RepID=A0A4C1SQN3_EUMVA|nr:hypothetical protein EVAR_101761_1 [Eumeta japonica]
MYNDHETSRCQSNSIDPRSISKRASLKIDGVCPTDVRAPRQRRPAGVYVPSAGYFRGVVREPSDLPDVVLARRRVWRDGYTNVETWSRSGRKRGPEGRPGRLSRIHDFLFLTFYSRHSVVELIERGREWLPDMWTDELTKVAGRFWFPAIQDRTVESWRKKYVQQFTSNGTPLSCWSRSSLGGFSRCVGVSVTATLGGPDQGLSQSGVGAQALLSEM